MVLSGRRPAGGFTLVELMVVVAIVAVLTTIAVLSVSRGGYSRNVKGLAAELAALSETARMRAVANKRWQQLEYDESARAVIHWEVDYQGMRLPTSSDTWNHVRTLYIPTELELAAMDDQAHDQDGSGIGAGNFDTTVIHFLPDGTIDGNETPSVTSPAGGTFFLQDQAEQRRTRVAIFQATGAAYALDAW